MIKYTFDELKDAVKHSFSVSEVIITLGLSKTGTSHALIKGKIEYYNLDTSHFCRKKRSIQKYNKRVIGTAATAEDLHSSIIEGSSPS